MVLAMLLSRYELVPAPGAQPVQPTTAVILETKGLAILCRPLG